MLALLRDRPLEPRVDDPRVDFVAVDFFGAGLRCGLVLRDRVLEPVRDVLLLRDPGGEDVRVAMVPTLGVRPTSHRDHTSACLGQTPLVERQPSVEPVEIPQPMQGAAR